MLMVGASRHYGVVTSSSARRRKSSDNPIRGGYGFHRASAFQHSGRAGPSAAIQPIWECPMSFTSLLDRGQRLAERIPHGFIALAARLAIASVFWRSGQTKVSGLQLREETFVLFREEYKVPLLPPDIAAYSSTAAEHVFPALLVIGFASRLSALALLGMVAVIQAFVYPGAWPEHSLWAALLILIVARGPGAVSLDHLIRNRASPMPVFAR
jgi:putative oxidoreductase